VLRAVGQAFRETVPDADAVFRLGGDEFAALIEDVGTSAALDVARRVVDAAHAILGRHGSALSIGVARIESDVDRLAVLRGADDAPYRAKREGLGAAYATEVQA
jgi:diguanylate cyclase (GGDEF)-like protein